MNPKQQARQNTDAMLAAKVWAVQDYKLFDLREYLMDCITDLKLLRDTDYPRSLLQNATISGHVFSASLSIQLHQLMTAQIRVEFSY